MAAKDSIFLGSDCDEVYITKIADDHLEYLREKIIKCLSNSKEFAAFIQHVPGQPAQMVVTLGSKQGIPEHIGSAPGPAPATREILVKNLPASSDKEHLQMFFEYEKGQGGGPVKHVALNSRNSTAVVEFEDAKAVNIVLNKRPIKMLGVTVAVEAHIPYLKKGETLKSIDLRGLPRDLIQVVAGLNIKANRGIRVGDKVRVKPSVQKPKFNWGPVSCDSVGTVHSIDSESKVIVRFPELSTWSGLLSEMELVE